MTTTFDTARPARTTRGLPPFATLLATLLVAGCGDSPTEPSAAAQVIVEGGAGIIGVGDSVALSARVIDARGTTLARVPVAWRSLDPSIASVDSLGRVRGEDAGTTAVIAQARELADTVFFTVEIQPRQLELVATTYSRPDTSYVGSTVNLRVVVRDGRGRVLSLPGTPTFAVDDTTIASTPTWSSYSRSASSTGKVGGTVAYTARMAGLEVQRRITYALAPISLAGAAFTQMGFGASFGCGLDTGGRAVCWGTNDNGQLGRGDTLSFAWKPPAPVAGGHVFTTLVVGTVGACGITAQRRLWCWGQSGQPWRSTAPTAILADQEVTEVVIGTYGYQTCARTADRALWCWGTDAGVRIAPRRMDTAAALERVALGYRYDWTFACGITTTGRASCTGLAFSSDSTFREVPGTYSSLASVVTGNGFGCGLDAEGRAWCWGSGNLGVRGRGFVENTWDPAANAVLTTERFTTLRAGAQFVCGITTAGAILCWGRHPAFPFQSVAMLAPTRISRDETFRSMVTTDDDVCGVRNDGDLRCLGGVIAPGAF